VQKEIQLTVVGKVFKPNDQKVLALNRCLSEYHRLVRYYLKVNSTSKKELHELYNEAKTAFDLPTALIQTARDKAVEALKSFKGNAGEDSQLKLKRISIRFDVRCYSFSKTTNALTPYWLNLKLNHERRVSLPVVFGERQKELIESAFREELKFATVETVKRNGEWYTHFILKKTVTFKDLPETVIGVDIGEANLVTAIALTDKPSKGQFWHGSEIKQIRGLYNHVRRRLGERQLLKKVKAIGKKERRKVDQQLHILANHVVKYAKQFPNSIIAMEDLNGLRERMKFSKRTNRRVHSMPYHKLQTYIEYKANLAGIEVKYVEARNTSKTCHRCGHVARKVNGREIRCPNCGLIYNRDLNGAINIAKLLKRELGWGSVTPLNSQMRLKAESLSQTGEAHKL